MDEEVVVIDNVKYLKEDSTIKLLEVIQDKFIEQNNKANKRLFIFGTIATVSIAVVFIIFLFGYNLFPPVKNYVQGDKNMVGNQESEMNIEKDGER